MHDLAGLEPTDEDGEDRSKREVVELEEVARPDVLTMILYEGSPRLAVTAARSEGSHIFLDGSFTDAKPELEELSANAFAAPGDVVRRHATDECDQLRRFPRLPIFLRTRAQPPVETKHISMPAQ